MGAGMLRNVTLSLVLDALAVRLHGERASEASVRVNLVDTDSGTEYGVWLGNAVLHHRVDGPLPDPDLTIRAGHDALAAILFGLLPIDAALDADQADLDGDADKLAELIGLLDAFDPGFPIVMP